MKIAVINGSPRKAGNGAVFIKKIIEHLGKYSDIDVKLINLSEREIKMCRGCQLCYERGEGYCPLKDDVTAIKNELLDCDGMIIYSPTYVVNMSGLLKNFIDRLSYICHRPAFYKKTALILTTTGSGGRASALKSIKWPAIAWGLRVAGSFGISMSKYNFNEIYKRKTEDRIKKHVDELITQTRGKRAYDPNIIELASFNIKKHNYLTSKNVYKYDVEYWRKNSWLNKEASYFFSSETGSIKKFSAAVLTYIIKHLM